MEVVNDISFWLIEEWLDKYVHEENHLEYEQGLRRDENTISFNCLFCPC